MRLNVMPPEPYSDNLSRSVVFFSFAIGAFLLEKLVANGLFVFIVMLAFFGAIVPLVNAKSREESLLGRYYSAFYSWVFTCLIAALLYYGFEWNSGKSLYIVMGVICLLGAVMEGILHKLFTDVDGTPDFTALLTMILKFVKLIARIVKAAYQAASIPTDEEKKDGNDTNRAT